MSNLSINKPSTAFIKQVLQDFSIVLPTQLNFDGDQGHLTNDSRMISCGDIFCAIIGYAQDGRQYIEQAIKRGAKLVLSECETEHDYDWYYRYKRENQY